MPQENKNTKKKINTGEMGGSGTTIYKGIISGVEYNSKLDTEYSGNGLDIYNRMRKSDPVVKASLNIIKLGILQAEWYVDPASDDAKDTEAAEFVEEALLRRLKTTFPETLKEILTYLDFGFSVVEKVFKIEDGQIFWKKFAFRDPKSIVRFEMENGKDGITQQLEGDRENGKREIPIEKLLVFSNEKEGDNWRGVSLLRSAYKPWFMKENIEKIDAIGFERTAVGIPVFKQPQNVNPTDVDLANELGENLRVNEKAYLNLPFGWDFDIKFPQGQGRSDADSAIKRYDRAIFANVLAQFLDLGSGNTGSRALSQDQSGVFYRSLQAVAEYIASVFNGHAIPQLVDLNFDGITSYPTLKVTGIDKIDVDSFSVAIQRLVSVGALRADSDLEDYLRNLLRLPPRMDQEEGTYEDDEGTNENPKKPTGNDRGAKKDKGDDTEDDTEEENKEILKGSELAVAENEKWSIRKPFWRDMTFAEGKVNLDSIKAKMDILEQEMMRELPKLMAPEITNMMADVRLAMQIKDPNRVNDIIARNKEELRQYVMDKYRDAFEVGKLSASNEMGIEAPRNDIDIINAIKVRAESIANKIVTDLESTARLTTLDMINQEIPIDEGVTALEQTLTDKLILTINNTASIVTSGGINQGRQSVFEKNPENIHALQRSEILDDKVCNYCLSMDGRVVDKDDPIAKYGPFHFHCRGIWVEILKEEEELPDITGVPEELRKSAGMGVGDFTQIKTPKPLEDSLAEEFLDERN